MTDKLQEALKRWQSLPSETRSKAIDLLKGEIELKKWIRHSNLAALTATEEIGTKVSSWEAAADLLEAAGEDQ